MTDLSREQDPMDGRTAAGVQQLQDDLAALTRVLLGLPTAGGARVRVPSSPVAQVAPVVPLVPAAPPDDEPWFAPLLHVVADAPEPGVELTPEPELRLTPEPGLEPLTEVPSLVALAPVVPLVPDAPEVAETAEDVVEVADDAAPDPHRAASVLAELRFLDD
ncbi:hypothetical protein [Nocardioides mangrovi]|uniref:DUF2339 domain-containing protein n=1 Tax=Nocardioides mangrovi TaxID=2874580 RepID=A0ABS7UGK6_9ACTN|nr:hypothetical protein [Nocardioides mangrovi]MBZ5740017.1 hypothetical protein [Nocardioides mangrovi]MBZ5740812.1 hypothetical protein [Nocardioides mangrovi]